MNWSLWLSWQIMTTAWSTLLKINDNFPLILISFTCICRRNQHEGQKQDYIRTVSTLRWNVRSAKKWYPSTPALIDPAFLWDRNKIPLLIQHNPTCIIYFWKGKGAGSSIQVDLKKSQYPNLQKFSYQHAATGASTSPCTNVVENHICY